MRHVLIVDDDVFINRMLEEVLVKENYRVSHAYSGTEALLLLSSCRPDLILLDLMLPGLSGDDVLSKSHFFLAARPIILPSHLISRNCWQGSPSSFAKRLPVHLLS